MTIEEHLAEALREVRLRNAQRINRIRVVGTGAFSIAIAVIAFAIGEPGWQGILIPTSAYFAIALVLMAGGDANPKILAGSRFVVPVVDMPMVLTIQVLNMAIADVPGHVSQFSVAIFVILLMLSAFTLNSTQIFISLGAAVLSQQILHEVAGSTLGARISSTIVFLIATWICLFAGRNRLQLAHTLTKANAHRQRLQRYFSPGVGQILEEQDEDALAMGKECELTVVITDIRGFTALTEQLPEREVVKLLNSYHARMVESIFRHGGTLDKYLGDGLMAYFNAPIGQPDHAERAVQCAMSMDRELAAMNVDRVWPGDLQLRVGIGVHTGRAVVGDIGAPHRREFTAIGEAVNVAAHLEELTKELPFDILVTEATANLVTDGVAWTEAGTFPIRGVREPVRILIPGIPPDRGEAGS